MYKNLANKMKTQTLGSDRISTLPDNIIEKILTLMPIRDALRTSVLSTKWRYSWRSMPKLAFMEDMVEELSSLPLMRKYKLIRAVFHVLFLHNGPTILKLCFPSHELQMASECDLIIGYLSRGNSVKKLKLITDKTYQLPASFFTLQGLETILLTNGVLELPLTFNGFSRLRKTVFVHVKVSAQMLQRFFSKCPLLEYIVLIGDEQGIDSAAGGSKFTFVDLLRYAPLIKGLEVTEDYVKCLSAGGMPHKLSASLVHLKYLFLEVCLMEQNEISSALCMIRSSLVLEKILIWIYDNEKLPIQQTPANFLDLDNFSDLILDDLETLEIKGFSNLPLEREFVKLIMAKSPVLKKVQIELNDDVSVDEEVKMLRDMVLLPFPRASPSAKLIIKRPEAE